MTFLRVGKTEALQWKMGHFDWYLCGLEPEQRLIDSFLRLNQDSLLEWKSSEFSCICGK